MTQIAQVELRIYSKEEEADFRGQLDNPCLAQLALEHACRGWTSVPHSQEELAWLPGSGTQMVVSCDEPMSGGTHLPAVTH